MKQRVADFAVLGTVLASCLSAPMVAAQSSQGQSESSAAIAAESLARALSDFTQQTGLQLIYVSAEVSGIVSKGAPGGLSRRETLARLLEDTGLSFEFINERTVRIFEQRAAAPTTQAESAAASDSTTAINKTTDRDMAVHEKGEMMRVKKRSLFGRIARLFTFCGPLIYSGPGICQSSAAETDKADQTGVLEEIVVTAEHREANVQKTGLAISVRQGDDLAQQGRVTLSQILEDIPGLGTFPAATPSTRAGADMAGNSVTIRGVASSPGTAGSLLQGAPASAVYTDGVYEGAGGSYDIDRVEVLRGPQGTLYGRSATSGAVRIHTRNPQLDNVSADISAEAGNYSLQNYTVAMNLPITDTLAFRVAGNTYRRDGYDPDQGDVRTDNGRVKMLWKPGASFSLLLGAVLQNNDTESVGLAPNQGGASRPDPDTITRDLILSSTGTVLADGSSRLEGGNRNREYWAELNWDLGPATLTYMPTYREWYMKSTVYAAGGPVNWLTQPLHVPNDKFITHELRLASNLGSGLTWQVGGFYYDNDVTAIKQAYWLQSGTLNFDINARRQTENIGVFGEATLPFTDALRFTAGVRYDSTEVQTDETYRSNAAGGAAATAPYNPNPTINSASTGGPAGTSRFYDLTYKARLEYDLAPSNMIYGMVSSAFVPGDVQITTQRINNVTTPVVVKYDEETLIAYELGSKNRFLGDTLQVNGALFYYKYSGYQASLLDDPTNPASQLIVSVPVRMIGGELEVEWRITANDRLALSYGYTDAKFTKSNVAGTTIDPRQNHLWNVVPWSANASYSHDFDLPGGSSLSTRVAGRSIGAHDLVNLSVASYNAGAYAYQRAKEAFIGDVDLTWTSPGGGYSVTGYVRNVSDERYKAAVTLTSPNGGGLAYLSDPRTAGVSFAAHF